MPRLTLLKSLVHIVSNNKALTYACLTIPVLLYGLSLLLTGNKIIPGDGDYYIQLYEAARINILTYHQIPWWNPWISGGVPLFANPQFGPISLQMIFALPFGSIFGYKIALVLYLVIGFWGMRTLLNKYYRTDPIVATLIAYIWTFNTFFVYRLGGHYTFLVAAFVPWMIYFYLTINVKKNWLWFALISSLIIWSSMHYTTTISFLLIFLFGLGQFTKVLISIDYKKYRNKPLDIITQIYKQMHISKILLAIGVILVATAPRLYATLEYVNDFPRTQSQIKEDFLGWYPTLFAMFGPNQYTNYPDFDPKFWGWHEISTYIGFFTGIALIICLVLFLKNLKQKRINHRFEIFFTILMIVFFISLSAGDFAEWSPYSILRELPIFSSMRVATRWINWAAFFVLIFIGIFSVYLKKQKRLIIFLLSASVVELFLTGIPNINNSYIFSIGDERNKASFIQTERWHSEREGIKYDENFTGATRSNVGQLIAGDSLIDTRQPNSTARCNEVITKNCKFVSDNAKIVYWSPHKIKLKRTGTGKISLNINPASHWHINGKDTRSYNTVDPLAYFIIEDQSENIEIVYDPPYTPFRLIRETTKRLF